MYKRYLNNTSSWMITDEMTFDPDGVKSNYLIYC